MGRVGCGSRGCGPRVEGRGLRVEGDMKVTAVAYLRVGLVRTFLFTNPRVLLALELELSNVVNVNVPL